MSAQRSTVYGLRQALLQGRYQPEFVDEEGKSTGEFRTIKEAEWIAEQLRPKVASLLGMFCEDPVLPRDSDGKPREISREELAKAGELVEAETLKQEVYGNAYQPSEMGGWGVVIDFDGKSPAEAYDECMALIPQALTEQRERCLDLIDRMIGAMVEDSCPPNKVPDEWDWTGIFDGFEEHFGIELSDDIADHSDREALARELYELAEGAFEKREEAMGFDILLQVFRHIYLQELDRTWVDHLTDMDHLRDGIGLRGYGQKDPKQEYKKEGYNMFVTMMARVSSNVVTKVMKAQVRRAPAAEPPPGELLSRQIDALARDAGADVAPTPPAVLAEQECPCGSGKKFSECHGAELDLDEADRARA